MSPLIKHMRTWIDRCPPSQAKSITAAHFSSPALTRAEPLTEWNLILSGLDWSCDMSSLFVSSLILCFSVFSNLISSGLFSSCFISSGLFSSRVISSCLFSSCFISSRVISSCLVSSCVMPSHLCLPDCHPAGEAEAADGDRGQEDSAR